VLTRRAFLGLIGAGFATRLAAGDAPPAAPRPLPSANDAYRIALADAERLRDAALLTRWVWVPDGTPESFKAVVLALNYVSRAATLVRPEPVAGGRLVRVDLTQFAPKAADLDAWLRTWEELRFDPAFSLLVTRDTLDLLAKSHGGEAPDVRVRRFGGRRKVKVPPYVADDGKTYDWEWQDAPDGFDEVSPGQLDAAVLRFDGLHLDPGVAERLVDSTNSEAPVVDARYFIARALTTIKDKGAFRAVFGGLYYDFVGIERDPKKGTAEDALYASLGLGDVEKGFTAADLFKRLDAEQRIAVFRSQVTGKPRRADFVNIPAVRGYEPLLGVTHDPGDADVDIATHPLLNLTRFKDKAREVIFVQPNGLHGYALFDANGNLQDEVPPDVAADHTVAAPHTKRLQPAISCLRCHVADGSEGWKAAENDARTLLSKRTAVYGDTDDLDRTIPETVDRLAGQYLGDPAKRLRRGREDLSEVVLRCTGPWKDAKADQSDVAKVAATKMCGLADAYSRDLIDARQALTEWGIEAPAEPPNPPAGHPGVAVELLRHVLRPARGEDLGGFVPVDPRLGALVNGLKINRTDFAFVSTFGAARARRVLAGLQQKPPAAPARKGA
jgi:hypothetical protein